MAGRAEAALKAIWFGLETSTLLKPTPGILVETADPKLPGACPYGRHR
jgi:hypothetical protein